MRPDNPAMARSRHVWRAVRQQSGVSCAIPIAASGIGVRPAPPTAHTIPAKALPTVYQFCPHFAHTFPGIDGKHGELTGIPKMGNNARKRWNTNEKRHHEAVRQTARKHTSYIYRVYEYDFKGFYFA